MPKKSLNDFVLDTTLKTCSGPELAALESEPRGHVNISGEFRLSEEKQNCAHDRENSLDDRFLWHIRGKRYDFRSFVDKHPAGPVMILTGQGRDCTELFESYHAMTDLPSKMLSKFEVRHGEPPIGESEFDWDATPFFDVVKKHVREYFRSTGQSHKANAGMQLRIVFGMIIVAVIVYYWIQGHWWTLLPLPFFYWTICSLLMHSGAHGAISHNWRVNHYLSYFGSFHSSLTTWIHQHNIGHHTHTNIDGKDPDLQHFQHLAPDNAPGYRLTNQQPWLPKYTNYLFAMFFQANFSASGPALLCEPLYYSTDSYLGAVPFRHLSDRRMMQHWAGRMAVFLTMFVLPFALHGPIKGLFFAFIPYNLLGCIFYLFSQVSHLTDDCFDDAPPPPADALSAAAAGDAATAPAAEGSGETVRKPVEWAVHQVVSTVDYSTGSHLWGALSIGLNNQVVHHLFPAVDPSHYPALAPIVARACAECGVRYTAYGSWAEAWRRHLGWVKRLNAVEPPDNTARFNLAELTGAGWAEFARARAAAAKALGNASAAAKALGAASAGRRGVSHGQVVDGTVAFRGVKDVTQGVQLMPSPRLGASPVAVDECCASSSFSSGPVRVEQVPGMAASRI